MSAFLNFIGHWHPVVVHLPIGVILAALMLRVMAMRPAFAALRPAVPVLLLAGAIAAMVSCVTGWILASGGEYDEGLVSWHRWMGISLAVLSIVLWVRVRGGLGGRRGDGVLALVVLGLVIVTGHLGGSLTHGADYLSFSAGGPAAEVDSPVVKVQEARVYQQVVRPILRDNCYGCHGSTRQKGGLRLDDPVSIMKGGKDGLAVVAGHGDASEMIKRLLLPTDDEHHMPPKDKKQLSERQILLLHWWVDQGVDFRRTVGELGQPDSVRPALLALQGAHARVVVDSALPAGVVAAADEKAVEALRAKGVSVMVVAQGRNWVEVDAAGAGGVGGAGETGSGKVAAGASRGDWVRLLLPLKKQLIRLRADKLDDSAMSVVGQCVELRSLDLAGSPVGDAGLGALRGLKELRVLNLVGTRVSATGVEGLKGLEKLQRVYLYRTKVSGGDWAALKKALPKAELDTGGYSLPFLESDTAVVRKATRKS